MPRGARLTGLAGRLAAAWLRPGPALNLGLVRAATGTFVVLYLLWSWDGLLRVAALDPASWRPVGPAAVWAVPPEPMTVWAWLLVTVVLGVAFTLGLAHRVASPLLALSLCFLFAWRSSWSSIFHHHNLFTLHVVVLALSPAAAGFSLDAWLGRRHPGSRVLSWLRWPTTAEPEVSAHWGWPLRLLSAVTVATYVVAGLAKVTGEAGFAWASADQLLSQIGRDAIKRELYHPDGATPLTWWLYAHRDWLWGPAVLTLVAELGAPVAMLHWRAAAVWAAMAWCLHAGIYVTMDIFFPYPMLGVAFLSLFATSFPTSPGSSSSARSSR